LEREVGERSQNTKEKWKASAMLWDKKVELKSGEERMEIKVRKNKDARQRTVPKDDRK